MTTKPVKRDGQIIPSCGYCDIEAVITVTSYGNQWACPNHGCDARVGIHANSKRNAPLGTLARAPLRRLRMAVHSNFDPLWKGRSALFSTRRAAYHWLSLRLGIKFERCHIGEFNEAQCRRALAEINEGTTAHVSDYGMRLHCLLAILSDIHALRSASSDQRRQTWCAKIRACVYNRAL